MSIFDKWNRAVDVEGLKKDIAEAEANGGSGDYKEVPVGSYEVKIDKMELKESKNNDPMFFCQFRILQGDFSNSCLFMNQVITQGFQIGQVNRFLRSLQVFDDSEIEFKDYSQYNDLILDLMEELESAGTEYLVVYKKSKKDFPIYTIKDVYEK